MKNSTKVFAAILGAAAAAAVIPYKIKADEAGGLVQGLLYKVKWTQDPDYLSEPDVHVTFGFNNPFKKEEDDLFADEASIDYCCDDTLVTNESRMYREEDYTADEDFEPEETGDEPCCGDNI